MPKLRDLFVALSGVVLAITLNRIAAAEDLSKLAPNLPDPLTASDGTRITTPEQWFNKRRPELLALMARQMYGQMPPKPANMKFEVFESSPDALDGRARRKQVAIYLFGDKKSPRVDMLIYLPKGAHGPLPVIFGMNFWGNHTVTTDPAVRLTDSYIEQPSTRNYYLDLSGVKNNHATDATRGEDVKRWEIKQILSHGFAFATVYRGDFDADRANTLDYSIRRFYPKLQNIPDNFTAIGAWAWGFSRGVDYLMTDPDIDPDHIAIFGWSRLGKAAIWAAANDPRIALIISDESGSGGAKLFHHVAGETVRHLNTAFPHWFCQNFRQYNDAEARMSIDQNLVLSLIAPRPIYASSSAPRASSDPLGEFLGLRSVEPVYHLLGASGLGTDRFPPMNQSVFKTLGYHDRTGRHDVTPVDWQFYLNFCDANLRPAPPR